MYSALVVERATRDWSLDAQTIVAWRLPQIITLVLEPSICLCDFTTFDLHVSTTEQIAGMFTKPLPRDQYLKLCCRFMGWDNLTVRE